MASNTYGLDPLFEQGVLLLLCTTPSFYSRFGEALTPTMLANPSATLLLQHVQAHAKEVGHGPASTVIALQTLRASIAQGRCTQEQYDAAYAYLDDAPILAPEDAAGQLKPVLRRVLREQAIRRGAQIYSAGGEFGEMVRLIELSESVGSVSMDLGSRCDLGTVGATLEEIASYRFASRAPTGIVDLDLGMRGGLALGQLGIVVSRTGGGKSLFLCQQIAMAMRRGMFVGCVTLELPSHTVQARTLANLTGVPTTDILDGHTKGVAARLRELHPELGTMLVTSMTPRVTRFPDIADWVHRAEDREKRKMDMVVVDYIGKMSSHIRGEESDLYAGLGTVCETMRVFVETEERYGWTASQATRGSGRAGKDSAQLTSDNMADSIRQAQAADVVLGLTRDGDTATIYVDKDRTGVSGYTVGPFPVDPATCNFAPTTGLGPRLASADDPFGSSPTLPSGILLN